MKEGDILVKRDNSSKSKSLWKLLRILDTSFPCIEVVPITKHGKEMAPLQGIYWIRMFKVATEEEIKERRKIA